MNQPRCRILVMIPYPSDIGFAIGRLITSFFEAAKRVAGGAEHVHFCFTDTSPGPSKYLPANFRNVVGLDVSGQSPSQLAELGQFVQHSRITTVFALDLPVQAKCLQTLRRAGAQKVISYWGAPMSARNSGLKLLAKRAEVRLLRPQRPDMFVFESLAMQDLAVLGRGVPREQTCVAPTGTDIEVFKPLPSETSTVFRRFGIPDHRKIVVYMGHFHERKGVTVLLHAADRIVSRDEQTDLHFLFLGTRDHEVTQLSSTFGPAVESGYVTFGGYQSDVPSLLAGCAIGCIPSSGWDSFPMSSLEMQACGLPMVVSDLQGVPETIEAGVTGLVFPTGNADALADCLTSLAANSDLRRSMSRRARERIARNFTTEAYVHRLEQIMRASVESQTAG